MGFTNDDSLNIYYLLIIILLSTIMVLCNLCFACIYISSTINCRVNVTVCTFNLIFFNCSANTFKIQLLYKRYILQVVLKLYCWHCSSLLYTHTFSYIQIKFKLFTKMSVLFLNTTEWNANVWHCKRGKQRSVQQTTEYDGFTRICIGKIWGLSWKYQVVTFLGNSSMPTCLCG